MKDIEKNNEAFKALSLVSRRIAELEAENAKLRERVAELEELLPENGRWFSAVTVEAYAAEIAKLREFVQYVADGVYKGLFCCNECRFFNGCYNNEKKEHDGRGCQWLLWSRELGIEVDE